MKTFSSKLGATAPAILAVCLSVVSAPQAAQSDILPNQPSVEFQFGGQSFSIRRDGANGGALPKAYAKTDRACPPYCIEPGVAAAGVATLTELDVFDFMENQVQAGSALLVDVRLPEDFASGSIPGAISVPAPTLVASNPYREDLLLALGAKGVIGNMDFAGAFDLLVFDDGPWSPTAREAIHLLLEAGYPASKLHYYRGGLQMWHVFGLTVSK